MVFRKQRLDCIQYEMCYRHVMDIVLISEIYVLRLRFEISKRGTSANNNLLRRNDK